MRCPRVGAKTFERILLDKRFITNACERGWQNNERARDDWSAHKVQHLLLFSRLSVCLSLLSRTLISLVSLHQENTEMLFVVFSCWNLIGQIFPKHYYRHSNWIDEKRHENIFLLPWRFAQCDENKQIWSPYVRPGHQSTKDTHLSIYCWLKKRNKKRWTI